MNGENHDEKSEIKKGGSHHAARKITIPDAPSITPLDWISQVLESINAQVLTVDIGLVSASQGEASSLKELSSNIHEILQKTIQSKAIVESLTADTSKLPAINTTLAKNVELLSKLKKLKVSLKELETELISGEFDYYRVISELLSDVHLQMAEFEVFRAVPQMAKVHEKLDAIESELKRQIQWSFRELGQLVPTLDADDDSHVETPIDISSLSQVSLVIDALGPGFRTDLLERFSQLQLIPYEKLFASGTKYNGLEFLDRRYAWFKRLLKVTDDKVGSLFPSHWLLPFYLFLEFSRRTRKHLHGILYALEKSPARPDIATHVQTMLKALKSLLSFEEEMKAVFAVYSQGLDQEVSIEYSDSLTEAFDPFLGPYVQLERTELEKLMSKIMANEDKGVVSEDEGPLKPGEAFVSARKMFEFIKKSLKRCTGYSTGNTYLALSREYRICLHNYAESLKFRCPSPEYTKPGQPLVYVVTPAVEETLCRIVVTGEYCIDTVPQLEAMMKKQITESMVDEIDFSQQLDVFNDMVAFTINIITQGITYRINPCFRNMRHTNWTTITTVINESPYVRDAIGIFNEAVPRIRNSISQSYFMSFCVKLVAAVLDSLLENVWKLKRITQTGSGQLLLDLNGLKEYLLKMPNVRLEAGKTPATISGTYKSVVAEKAHRVEIILKLICTDDAQLEETFALLWPEGTPEELEKLKAIKGKGTFLDPVGDTLKTGATKIGTTVVGEKAMGEIKSGLGDIKSGIGSSFKIGTQAFGGIKSAFGDMTAAIMSGDLLNDGHSGHGSSSHGKGHSIANSSHGHPPEIVSQQQQQAAKGKLPPTQHAPSGSKPK